MTATQDYVKALDYIIHTHLSIPALRVICRQTIFNTDFINGFGAAVDTSHHHAYKHGLLVHTHEVTMLCAQHLNNDYDINEDVLISAAILHDAGKVYDYTDQGYKTHNYKMIRHVARSYQMFMQKVSELPNVLSAIPPEIIDAISHCILAHHGRKEWGSPVEPETPEAHILHYVDLFSARFGRHKDKSPIIDTSIETV